MTRDRSVVAAAASLLVALSIVAVSTVAQTYPTSGTGFIVASSGYILTSYHVVEGATGPITITLSDGTKHEARVVDYSPTTDEGGYDAALLKIEASGLPTIPIADSDQVQLFDQVVVLGYPLSFELGVSLNVTGGNITAFRKIKDSPEMLQIDAAVNPGNSGGPALDAMGRAVGIVTSKIVGEEVEGVSFLVPINLAAQLVTKHVVGWTVSTADTVLTSREIVAAATPAVVYVEWSDVYVQDGEYKEPFTQSREWVADYWNEAGYAEVAVKEKGTVDFVECPAEASGPSFEVEVLFSTCTKGCAAGLAFFPSEDDTSQWSFMVLIDNEGNYGVFKQAPGGNSSWVLAGQWTPSSNLKEGKDVANRILIDVVKRNAQISFNGATPGTLGVSIPLNGTLALCVVNFDGTTTVRFDNLRIFDPAWKPAG
ncbi:MAG: trypsin-like peptidase domain-containing protein [Thermotogota bacterium]